MIRKSKPGRGAKSSSWTGEGEISGNLYGKIRRDAARRNILFNVNLSYLWSLFLKQRRKCALTGWDLNFADKAAEKYDTERTASLDRINSDLGYTRGNLRWVHKSANLLKNDLSDKDFFKLIKAIAKHKRLLKV